MSVLEAIILAIVEGLTEFIPVSSTGHLVLAADVLNIAQTNFVKSFEIAIQLGAILAIVALYWKKLLFDKKVFARLAVAFVPTAILGFVLYGFMKEVLLGNTMITLAALFFGVSLSLRLNACIKNAIMTQETLENFLWQKHFLWGSRNPYP